MQMLYFTNFVSTKKSTLVQKSFVNIWEIIFFENTKLLWLQPNFVQSKIRLITNKSQTDSASVRSYKIAADAL